MPTQELQGWVRASHTQVSPSASSDALESATVDAKNPKALLPQVCSWDEEVRNAPTLLILSLPRLHRVTESRGDRLRTPL